MKRYVISDLHLGHKAILQYRTQFTSLDDMHDTIINNWNSVVTPQDKVYILGDVAWNKQALALLNIMNGKKILIKGNHDILPLKEYLKYFEDIRGAMEYKSCILTHIPVHESQLERFKLNIHGHLHNEKVIDTAYYVSALCGGRLTIKQFEEKDFTHKKYINVCCEQVNYTPVLLEGIINE